MSLVTKTIPGVYGGVSNQVESLRKDNQVTEMINCVPGLVSGTTRRPNVSEVATNPIGTTSFIYDYSRSSTESNIITIQEDGSVECQEIGVGPKPVVYEDEAAIKAYLAHTDPSVLNGITIGDTTYICNSTVTVTTADSYADTMSADIDDIYTGPLSEMEAIPERFAYYWCSRSSNDSAHPYRYVVELDGVRYETDSDKSDDAARALALGLSATDTAVQIKRDGVLIDGGINGQTEWTCDVVGSIIRIYKTDIAAPTDWTFDYWDSWGSQASYGWKYDVGKLQDLPVSFPWDGAIARINSNDGSGATNYFVKRWKGTWQEYTNRGGSDSDRRTFPLMENLPIVIERLETGEFSVRTISTSDQLRPPLVGNSTNNKDPYFVGKQIKQLFYINGRMCVVSGDALTFSEVDVLWNFYATTVIDVLHGDTIEVKIASERVLEIQNVAIFQSGLLIMTSEGQYLYNTETGINPMTVAVNKLSNYSYNDKGGTVYDGDSIVFSGSTGDTARIYRYRVARLTSENKALDLTIQVPTYIKGTVEQITNFVEDGTLALRTTDAKKVYLYKEVVSGDQMVQSSWYTWDFSNILTEGIQHIMVIDTDLYFISSAKLFKIPLGVSVFTDAYQHIDLGTTPYDSIIELTKWRVKKTQSGVQTPRGRLQLRTLACAIEGKANLKIYKEDRGYTQVKPIVHNKGINILSNTDKTVLTIVNEESKPFTISGMAMSGTYREKGRETT